MRGISVQPDTEDLVLAPILAAALTEFQEHGYHGAKVRQIAGRASLTVPSLYYHYGSKEGILFALLDVAMDDLASRIGGGLQAAGEDAAERFSSYVVAVALHNTQRRDLARLHDEFRVLSPELRERYVAKRSAVEETLVDLLDAGVAHGIFAAEDTRFVSRVILGMLGGIVDWYTVQGPFNAERIAYEYAQSAVRLVSA